MSCLQNSWMFIFCTKCISNPGEGGGGKSLYERGGDARRKFELNP